MMTREMIISELTNRGYNATAQDSTKNGVVLEGIIIRTEGSAIAPVIYTEQLISRAEEEGKSLDDVVSRIIDTYEAHKDTTFNIAELTDRDFVLSHIRIGLQKASNEDLIKGASELEGIESYLYIGGEMGEDGYSIKVSASYLENASVSESEAWEQARKNTFADTQIESMAKVMSELMGVPYDEEMESEMPMYIITNRKKMKGASAICDRKHLAEFTEQHHTKKLLVLPSSVHEMIIIPYTDDMDIEMFSDMVSQVNASEVAPEERLTDRAYVLEF
ncbi:hypothetical protein SAMN02745229_03916 [Butyrivibrio fibrisolvens DSM 3071]|uniref:Uncharacterized protein n=1 Tax=Butyrivibrio fibrisolvens DSM 3071 TaxID=1121131 RepID=A0A1M6FHG1_BUTFI|nr:DUF5688 family protein [Butyrivibrio fibrisolvens]SHI97178.1 hypothetical protein SAMN02745229_03916 [Butyrivibrio fibrisolvens DSM 3071]